MQESLEASLVRIHSADGHVVGAGFLVGERHILTCAHVISKALDLAGSPVDPPSGVVSLDFSHIPPHTLLTASVVLWCPPLPDGSGDLAGLELEREPPTGAERVHFASAEDVWKHDFSALGFPEGYNDGVWATGRLLRRQATNWIQVEDVKAQGFAVGPGFSGAPVWDEQLQGVVGMVVAASRPADTRTAFVIPLDVLAAAWPLLEVPQDQARNPYKGLRPFTQRDAADFFGREAVVEKVVDLVSSLVTKQPARSSTRLLTILGPSGVGKSSLIMAGLLPHLQQGALLGSKDWVYLDPLLPGKHPLEALASTLKPHFPDTSFKTLREDLQDDAALGLHLLAMQIVKQSGTSVVLLIDQCEELFTQTESEDERQRFIRLLLNACSEPRGALLVLLTLRADFYDRPMQYPELFRLIETQHLSLLAIEPNDLRRVVEQPAALPDVQVTFEGDLVNRLLFEVQGQVGALPLLQFTLDQLFQQRSRRQLTLSAYREMGGVKGALTRHAEATHAALPSEEHRTLARVLVLRLIDPGLTEQDTARRRAALAELSLPDPSQTKMLREVADAFVAARLLTTNEVDGTTTIEVSHEALNREWTRLSDWLRTSRSDILLQKAINEDAEEWMRRGKPAYLLYRDTQLDEAKAWAERNMPNIAEVAFLQASARERERQVAEKHAQQVRELNLQRRVTSQQRRVIGLMGVISVVLLVGLVVALVLYGQLQVKNHDLQVANQNLHRSLPVSVTNVNDNGPGSLREAIKITAPGGAITFANNLKGSTINLTSGELVIDKDLTISGQEASFLTISGENISRVFRVTRRAIVFISNLTITNGLGDSDGGGGILAEGDSMLTLINVTVSGSKALYGGGIQISTRGRAILTHSVVSRNIALEEGGGIFSNFNLILIGCTISDNSAFSGGGLYSNQLLTISSSTIVNNKAIGSGGGISYYGLDSKSRIVYTTVYGNSARIGGGIARALKIQ
jgi:hypothetical protein